MYGLRVPRANRLFYEPKSVSQGGLKRGQEWRLAGFVINRPITQRVDELANFVALAVCLLFGLFRELFVGLQFSFRFVAFSKLAVDLSETIVGFFHLRIRLSGFFKSCDCL